MLCDALWHQIGDVSKWGFWIFGFSQIQWSFPGNSATFRVIILLTRSYFVKIFQQVKLFTFDDQEVLLKNFMISNCQSRFQISHREVLSTFQTETESQKLYKDWRNIRNRTMVTFQLQNAK